MGSRNTASILTFVTAITIPQFLSANTTTINCHANVIDDGNYKIVSDFSLKATESDLYNIEYVRSKLIDGSFQFIRWRIENISCSSIRGGLLCDYGTRLENANFVATVGNRSGVTQNESAVPKAARIQFTVRTSRVGDDILHNYPLAGSIVLSTGERMEINQQYKKCAGFVDTVSNAAPSVPPTLQSDSPVPAITSALPGNNITPPLSDARAIPLDPPYPVATQAPDNPHHVISPFDQKTILDVEGLPRGSKVRDPITDKIFLVP